MKKVQQKQQRISSSSSSIIIPSSSSSSSVFRFSSLWLFVLILSLSVATVSSTQTLVWFLTGVLTQKCNLAFEYYQGFNVLAIKRLPINTLYSFNTFNTTSLLAIGYAFPCNYVRNGELFFDKECNDDDLQYGKGIRPFGCIMYNPDMRKGEWLCLGEEPRIARYHASYGTITMYDKSTIYTDNGIDHNRKVTCSTICVIGGQQVTWLSNLTTTVEATTSVMCVNIGTTVTAAGPVYHMNWTEVEPIPYTLVGATAMYSNGTLFVIGGIRGNYDQDTTSSILEADVDPNTCLPYNWRNYGYSSTSRLGNQKQLQNWTTDKDVLDNRTLIWVTEGPPAYPKLSGDSVYDNYPHVYPPNYYPTVLTGGGVRVPSSFSYTPDTYTTSTFFLTTAIHDSYYIPVQPIVNEEVSFDRRNDTLTISRTKIYNDISIAGNPAVPINLNLPFSPNNWLDQLYIFDRTLRIPTKTIEPPVTYANFRRYEWLMVNGKTMYEMYTSGGDIISSWSVVLHESGQLDGEISIPISTLPSVASLAYTFIGNTGDIAIVGTDVSVLATYTAFLSRCISCSTGNNYMSTFCRSSPFEGVCTSCTICNPDRLSNPTYQISPCTRTENARCAKCRNCIGGSPLKFCNITSDTECDPELEALASKAKWKRIPIPDKDDTLYLGCSFSLLFLWLFVCSSYSIHKTQVSTLPNTVQSTSVSLENEKSTTMKNDFYASVQEIIRSSPFRRALSSTIQHTFQLFAGFFSVFSYIFFNLCLLYSLQTEEINGSVFSDYNSFYMGSVLRESVFRSSMVTIVFLLLSILLNGVWIIYHYRVIHNIPFYLYLIFPWVSFHHRLLLWMQRMFLIPLLLNRKCKNTVIMNNGLTKEETMGLTVLSVFSSICADGVQLLVFFSLSDTFGATISSGRPVTVGVGFCAMVNTIYSLRKLYLILFAGNGNVLSNGSRIDQEKGTQEIDTIEKKSEIVDFLSVTTPSSIRGVNHVSSSGNTVSGSKTSAPIIARDSNTDPDVGCQLVSKIPSASITNAPTIPSNNSASLLYLDPTQMNFATTTNSHLRSHPISSTTIISNPVLTNVLNPVFNNTTNNNTVFVYDSKPLDNGPCTPPWRHTVSEHGLIIEDQSPLFIETVGTRNRCDNYDGNDSYVSGHGSGRVQPVARTDPPLGISSLPNNHNQQQTYAPSSASSSSGSSRSPHIHALDRYKRVEQQLSKSLNEIPATDTSLIPGYFTYVIDEKSVGSTTDQNLDDSCE